MSTPPSPSASSSGVPWTAITESGSLGPALWPMAGMTMACSATPAGTPRAPPASPGRATEERPTAKVTVMAPNSTAVTIAAARAGRAKGRASPRPTALGNGSPAARRAAHRPRPAAGNRPTASASTVHSRPARHALTHAVTVTTPNAPAATTASIHGATDSPEAPYASAVSDSNGTAGRLPARSPSPTPAAAGTSAWAM
ncbi:hypothetical protein ACGFMO_36055 [Streptomyces niveus]|uniref:hypothetical protein n=1 Tax=Streptomyces niveus TaxID=193462 RepID=UPI003720E14B